MSLAAHWLKPLFHSVGSIPDLGNKNPHTKREKWDRGTEKHPEQSLTHTVAWFILPTALHISGKSMVFAINSDGPLDIHMEKRSSDPYHNIHKN